MVHMKLTRDDLNVKELNIKYEGPQFERYRGDIPKSGTVLNARVTKMWWTVSSNGNSMIKLIAIAEQNSGKLAEFNGLPVWENLTFVKEAARRYGAFFACFDLTIDDVFKHLDVEPDDDNVGTPINSISDWEVGSDDALCQIVTKRGTDNDGNMRAEIDWDGWLPFDEDMAAEFAEENRPTRSGRSRAKSDGAGSAASSRRGAATRGRSRDVPDDDKYEDDDDVEDEDVYDDEEDEEDIDGYEDEDEDEDAEEEPPARPRRGARPARSASPARASRSDGSRSGRSSSRRAEPAGARSGGRSAGRSASRSAEARRASRATDRDRANRGSVDEPPF